MAYDPQEVGRAGTFQFSRPDKSFCFVLPASIRGTKALPFGSQEPDLYATSCQVRGQLVSCWFHVSKAVRLCCFCRRMEGALGPKCLGVKAAPGTCRPAALPGLATWSSSSPVFCYEDLDHPAPPPTPRFRLMAATLEMELGAAAGEGSRGY